MYAGEANCRVIGVFEGSILVIVQITTGEQYFTKVTNLADLLGKASTTTLQILATGLSNETATVNVSAVLSSNSTIDTYLPQVPSPVQNVSVQFPSSECTKNANLSWRPPSDDGGASVSSYIVVCSSDTASSVGYLILPSITAKEVGPFEAGNEYSCSILALNARGFSNSSTSPTFDVM